MGIQKTNLTKSPLLKPVIERDYTKGISFDNPNGAGSGNTPGEKPPAPPDNNTAGGPAQPPNPPGGQKFNIPPDETRGFTFNDIPEPGDIEEGEHSDGIGLTGASAKTFANFVGDAIQLYLPNLTYEYSKIDIENVIMNIQKGILTENWLEAFNKINGNTKEALKISDEEIKMWKKAFKDWLEYNQFKGANPNTAMILATLTLLGGQVIRGYQSAKTNEMYMKQAIQHCRPDLFIVKEEEKKGQPAKNDKDGADSVAA